MGDFFATMDSTQSFYWYIAIGASAIFLVQTIMTFFGSDSDTGADADFDGNLDSGAYPFQLFSLRNLINFILGFGWGGVVLYDVFDSKLIVAILSAIIGVMFVAIFFFIMRSMMKFSEDNTFSLEKTIGKSGEVYLTIPPAKKGKGKVFVSVKGSTRELDAITNSETEIKRGTLVKIIAIESDLLVVEAFK